MAHPCPAQHPPPTAKKLPLTDIGASICAGGGCVSSMVVERRHSCVRHGCRSGCTESRRGAAARHLRSRERSMWNRRQPVQRAGLRASGGEATDSDPADGGRNCSCELHPMALGRKASAQVDKARRCGGLPVLVTVRDRHRHDHRRLQRRPERVTHRSAGRSRRSDCPREAPAARPSSPDHPCRAGPGRGRAGIRSGGECASR